VEPILEQGRFTIHAGDCLERLKHLDPDSVDALVTDPPAGISFMGKDWDSDKGGRAGWVEWMTEVMRECLRVMKPGAHGLVWALPRTSHWTATALEDAGFEVRDVVTHLFGSGFPKSLDVSKAFDKAAGAERKIIGENPNKRNAHVKGGRGFDKGLGGEKLQSMGITAPATDAAKQWSGWGTALKPASEHWILVRKPISENTVAANVLKWGTGAINIDGSRIEGKPRTTHKDGNFVTKKQEMFEMGTEFQAAEPSGRFPANLVLSHSPYCEDDQCDVECAVAQLDAQSGTSGEKLRVETVEKSIWGGSKGSFKGVRGHGDSGGASRFFYCAKISSSERNAGLEGMPDVEAGIGDDRPSGQSISRLDGRAPRVVKNHHPTVKPQKLMRYFCRMITPPGGLVLDPFMGSGSTGIAALKEGFRFVGIEREPEYFEIAEKRVGYQHTQEVNA